MHDPELREVYSAANVHEAHLVRAALEQEGIQAHVVGDHLQNAVGDLPAIAIAPRIWVRTGDFEQARKIILEHQADHQTGNLATPEWTCSQCGESNEPTFDICWNCQTARADDKP